MAYGITNTQHYSDIADAIRAKRTDLPPATTFTPADMAQAIQGITGGGVTPAERKAVNFIDYDGTILYSYSTADFLALAALPANPTHDGLTAQGWNWTLADAQAQVTAQPNDTLYIGQMYVTTSGKSEIDISLVDSARLSPYLALAPNGTVTVDWGDGSATSTVSGTSLTSRKDTQHTYAAAGDYTIKITVDSGSFAFYGSSVYPLLHKNSSTVNANTVYTSAVKAVRIGTDAEIGSNAFNNCYNLETVTIPSGITSIGQDAFRYCYSLQHLTIPSNVTSIGQEAFYYCYSISEISLPSGVTSIGSSAIRNCYSLQSFLIPSGITSIESNTFGNCYSLASLTIPSGVTSIATSAFSSCYGMAAYHFKPTTPPTLSNSNAFSNIQSDCKIYVPSASLATYQAASNWSTYSSYMVGE